MPGPPPTPSLHFSHMGLFPFVCITGSHTIIFPSSSLGPQNRGDAFGGGAGGGGARVLRVGSAQLLSRLGQEGGCSQRWRRRRWGGSVSSPPFRGGCPRRRGATWIFLFRRFLWSHPRLSRHAHLPTYQGESWK